MTELCARCGHVNPYHLASMPDSPCYEQGADGLDCGEWCGCPAFVPPKERT